MLALISHLHVRSESGLGSKTHFDLEMGSFPVAGDLLLAIP